LLNSQIFIKSNFNDRLLILLMVLGTYFFMPLFKASQIATNVLIPIVFLHFSIKLELEKLVQSPILKFFIYFFLWSLFASLFAQDFSMVFYTEKKKFLVLIFMITLFAFASDNFKNSIFTLRLLLYVLILTFIYSYSFAAGAIESGGIREIDDSQDEINTIMDSNGYGYIIFIGISSSFILFDIISSKLLDKLKLFTLILAGFYLILSTASRGAYIIFSMLVISNLIIFFFQLKAIKNLRFLIIIVLLMFLPNLVGLQSKLIEGSKLEERFNVGKEEGTTRELLFADAMRIGLENPILGVGGGNYSKQVRSFEEGSFSHNSYSEAFANYGILGLGLLCSIYFEFLYVLIRAIRDRKIKEKKVYLYFLSFLVAFIAYNIFYVTYLTIEFMGAFIIMRVAFSHFIMKDKMQSNLIQGV
jgi:O-antigen ligase